MTAVSTIDSNVTELAWAEEASFKILPGTPVWNPAEPNSYGGFGGEITTISREPIASDRQRRKPVVVDLDATIDFEQDVTQTNMSDLLQGFMFANYRKKAESAAPSAVTNPSTFTVASGVGSTFRAGDLVEASGFTNSPNNGLFRVASSTSTTIVVTATNLVTETPPTAAKLVVVGFQFAETMSITQNADVYPFLSNTGTPTKDLTQLGLIPGEWVFIGDGSGAAFSFATAANNGFARVRSVTATTITFDKTYGTMVTDAGTGKTIRLFLGRVLKNETGTSIVRRSYNFERKLGVLDTAVSANPQSEYVIGAVPSDLELKLSQAAKITASLKYVGADSETRTGTVGVKSGTRATLVAQDAFNTTSDVSYIKLATVSNGVSNPTPLFDFLSDISVTINNNVKGNKAIGRLGSFEANSGSFDVSAKLTAYFANIAATGILRAGSSLTLDMHLVKNNAGISIDLPQLVSSKALYNVRRNEPIDLPLESNAASAVEVDSSLNHTLLMVFFDYLPSVADV